MQEQECFPNNTFSDSNPDIDIGCGCIDDYDLTDWNDTEPIDDENGSFNPMPDERRHGAPCLADCTSCPDYNNCPLEPDFPECPDCPDCPCQVSEPPISAADTDCATVSKAATLEYEIIDL